MKKLTPRYRNWLARRQRRLERSHRTRSPEKLSQRRRAARAKFFSVRTLFPRAVVDLERRPPYACLIPPEIFSLEENYGATVGFVLDLRRYFWERGLVPAAGGRPKRVFAEFSEIAQIEPAAGLMIAAEIDRWRRTSGRQPRMWDRQWQPAVKRFFVQAGLFELLGIPPEEEVQLPSSGPVETIKFVQGRSVSGEPGSNLRDRLEELCGSSLGPRRTVYEAIAEAIANTRHAYPTSSPAWPMRVEGRWWASGSWQRATNTVSVQLYDQGVGIPATLPRSEHWSDVVRLVGLANRLHPERDDHRLIEAALEVGRTSTGQSGRGKGLAEMTAWIDKRDNGFLRIRSGRGTVLYRPGGRVEGRLGRAPFPGTLIEWEIGLGD